jgi:hypothetical protein
MKRFRYSIRTLMGGVVLMGVAFAGLRSPTPFWANLSFSLVLAGLILAVPTAVYRRGERRAFWVGFATFGWVYFVLTLLPWFETEIGFQLFSTTLLDLLAPYVVKKELLLRNYVGSFNPPFDPVAPSPWQHWNLPELPPNAPWQMGYATLISPGLYLRIGHAVFCVMVAFLGGEAVRYLAATRSQGMRLER